MKPLIHRLRGGCGDVVRDHRLMREAADEIERLSAFLQVSRLNGAWDNHPDQSEVDALINTHSKERDQ